MDSTDYRAKDPPTRENGMKVFSTKIKVEGSGDWKGPVGGEKSVMNEIKIPSGKPKGGGKKSKRVGPTSRVEHGGQDSGGKKKGIKSPSGGLARGGVGDEHRTVEKGTYRGQGPRAGEKKRKGEKKKKKQ